MIGIYPGSFDPLTLGHCDVIKRASSIFDTLYICISRNIGKTSFFTIEERLKMTIDALADYKNVKVESFDGLLVDYFKAKNAKYVIRGLRAVSDFEYELQMALTNRSLYHEFETIFLMPSQEYIFLSSTIIKDIARNRGDVSAYLPENIDKAITAKMKKLRTNGE